MWGGLSLSVTAVSKILSAQNNSMLVCGNSQRPLVHIDNILKHYQLTFFPSFPVRSLFTHAGAFFGEGVLKFFKDSILCNPGCLKVTM